MHETDAKCSYNKEIGCNSSINWFTRHKTALKSLNYANLVSVIFEHLKTQLVSNFKQVINLLACLFISIENIATRVFVNMLHSILAIL